jgi:hypothetical protein
VRLENFWDAGPWYLVDGTLVAHSSGDLEFGDLTNPINLDENGLRISSPALGNPGVWTGPMWVEGSLSGDSCNDWTSSSGTSSGTGGDFNATDTGWWQEGPNLACSNQMRLYCLESSDLLIN